MPTVNNFDILRLLFAAIVVFVHCAELSNAPALREIPHVLSQHLAVEGFFTMSGCLVVASYDRSRSLADYFEKRARRILPLYWLVVTFGIVLSILISSLPPKQFLSSPDFWKYLFAQLSFANFLHPSLPGVFGSNANTAINGSLWTIKIEVMFYLLVPLIVFLCRKLGKWKVLSVIFILSDLYRLLCERFHHESLAVQLPGQLVYFVVGTAGYYYYPWFKAQRKWTWVAGIVAYVLYIMGGGITCRAIGISLLVFCCALFLPAYQGPTKYGDCSYGTYVFHWPVAQTFIAYGMFTSKPLLALSLVVVVVAILSMGSWNCVEKPCLRRNARPTSRVVQLEAQQSG